MSQASQMASGKEGKDEAPGIYVSPIIFCVSILIYEFYVYNVVYLGRILPTIGKADFVPLFVVVFNLVWFMTLWCYISVRYSDPGTITEQWRTFAFNTIGLEPIVSRQEWQPGKVTTNKKSSEIRPERAHFCSTIRKDVLRMDHFCPWTGNTVGFNNQKHFLLLGFYGALAGFVAFLTSMPDLVGCTTGYAENAYVWASVSVADRCQFIIFGVFAILVMLLLGGLFTSHFPLACRNMTTIEELYTNMPNPYDHQKWFTNLEQTFGGFGWDWFFPVKPRRLKSDGFSYRRNGEVLPPGLVEVYGKEVKQNFDDKENFIHKLPEDIWHFRYTGRTRAQQQDEENAGGSWLTWLAGG
jgi:palmitoyltransferase